MVGTVLCCGDQSLERGSCGCGGDGVGGCHLHVAGEGSSLATVSESGLDRE